MTFDDILEHALELLQRRGRVTYRTLKRQFKLDDDALEDLKHELITGQRLATDEGGEVLVWIGSGAPAPLPIPAPALERVPLTYTPPHLAEKILTSGRALEGERKQVTVLFADIQERRRCAVALHISRPPSFSMRRASFPTTNTPSRTR